MSTTFRGVSVTAQDILAAMRNFDSLYSDTNECDSWLEKKTYKYAVEYNGKLYPCKHILSQATRIDTSDFNGGEETNRIFRELGLHIIDKP
jgi:hypothetical protein